jgi:2-polyprenyl-6-methoxyphenol hydroxylase-like FAD-dependent oxidoreductase
MRGGHYRRRVSQIRSQAVVLGGSIAGLLAAAALAPRYDSVVVVERDLLPAGVLVRRGVPQALHVHVLLPSGQQAIEDLLPDFTERLVTAGARRGDALGSVRWNLNGRQLQRSDSGLAALSASRPLIEHTVRALVREVPNVQFLDGHDIVGLTIAPGSQRSVQVASRDGGGTRLLPADLVVDATGRGSRMPLWLTELGYPRPEEDVVDIDVRYSSRVLAADIGDDLVVVTARYPGQQRSSVMQRLEDGRVLVTLAGIQGEQPPGDLAGFATYAESLATPDTSRVLATATPIGDPASFRFPAYIRRRYERAALPPDIVVIGDAACAFNPVYGQGMSVAAMSALALRSEPDPARFHARQAELVEAAWTLAVGADLDDNDYLRTLQLAAVNDAELAVAFVRVAALVDPPQTLFAPWIRERLAPHSTALA